MKREHYDETERRPVSAKDFKAALKDVLLAPRTKVRSENREPTKAELEERHRLDRKDRIPSARVG